MNLYRVWYTYTEPSCDSPEVLVHGDNLYLDTVAFSYKEAKAEVQKNSSLNMLHENVRAVKSKLLKKNIGTLEKGHKYKAGIGTLLLVEGVEVAIVCGEISDLENICKRVLNHTFVLDKEKLAKVKIMEYNA